MRREGSTSLWDVQPQAMRVANARHDALLREIFASHCGDIFKLVGDAFCVAFGDAGSAVVAAFASGAQKRSLVYAIGWRYRGSDRAASSARCPGCQALATRHV